ncbi:hypothetical protein GCM10020254_42260 [Streptomyces goshikiensis]
MYGRLTRLRARTVSGALIRGADSSSPVRYWLLKEESRGDVPAGQPVGGDGERQRAAGAGAHVGAQGGQGVGEGAQRAGAELVGAVEDEPALAGGGERRQEAGGGAGVGAPHAGGVGGVVGIGGVGGGDGAAAGAGDLPGVAGLGDADAEAGERGAEGEGVVADQGAPAAG